MAFDWRGSRSKFILARMNFQVKQQYALTARQRVRAPSSRRAPV
jgi:hypothetical protein